MFTEEFKKGEPYWKLPPCIHVGILDFNMMESAERRGIQRGDSVEKIAEDLLEKDCLTFSSISELSLTFPSNNPKIT